MVTKNCAASTAELPSWNEVFQAEKENWDWDLVIKKFAGAPKIERAYAARQYCGLWDVCDPVADAILDLVEVQNELAQAISAEQYAVVDAPEVGPTLKKRVEAALNLMRALLLETESVWTPQGYQAEVE
jgi:hypothetical protein